MTPAGRRGKVETPQAKPRRLDFLPAESKCLERDGTDVFAFIWIIAYRNIYPAVMEFMKQGYFYGETLITKKITLDQIVDEGFDQLVKDKSQIKILVSPE